MSSAMASSSVSQEDVENDFEKSSRRSRIRMARGRDVRGQQSAAAAATRLAADMVAETEDAGETRAPDASGYSGDHDASPKPAGRVKDKRPARPPHTAKGKQQQQRDRRKLREKRRSSGVVHMPSTEMSSTGGSSASLSSEEDEEQPGPGSSVPTTETKRPALEPETVAVTVPTELRTQQFQNSLRNKSLSDLDADDEDNQDCDSLGPSDTPLAGERNEKDAAERPTDRLTELEAELRRLRRELAERDRRIAGLEAASERGRLEQQQLQLLNDQLARKLAEVNTN